MDTEPSAEGPLSDEWCMHHFDPQSPELPIELPATMARMRTTCPVAHSDQYGGFWVATKYADVVQVAQNWETFSSEHGLTVPPLEIAVRNVPIEVDPPVHRTYKRLINAYFTPAVVRQWEDRTRQLANRLIDAFIERGRCDFMAEFARLYPSLAFFDFTLNAPPEDLDKLSYMTSKSGIPTDPESTACWLGLSEWVKDFIEARRSQPPLGDVVDGVLAAKIDGRPLTQEETIGVIQLLIVGGLETTATALGMMMVRFCRQPEIPAQLRREPEVIPRAVEELLRLDPPLTAVARTAVREGELGGHHVDQGDRVLVYWSSANRDEDEFDDSERFDLGRSHNRHLAFGVGPHRCAGSNLARMNLRVALSEVLQRLDDIRLEDNAELDYHLGMVRGLLALPITFTPGRRSGQTAA